jgi:hypothetical protein
MRGENAFGLLEGDEASLRDAVTRQRPTNSSIDATFPIIATIAADPVPLMTQMAAGTADGIR